MFKKKRPMEIISTIPPYAPYIEMVAKHPLVSGVRLNTVMPIKEPLEEYLSQLKDRVGEKDIWIDLKCRQIRVINFASTPYHHLEISHNIKVNTPTEAWFNDGLDVATIAKIDGKKLYMLDGPKRVVGPGESLNILDPSLEIEGFLTETDEKYIEAARKVGIHTYMASYVEEATDITDILQLDPDAKIAAKIESNGGLDFVDNVYPKYKKFCNLMAARGDLYVEVDRPHQILKAVKKVVKADKDAIIASRIMGSLRNTPIPSCPDITDVAYNMEIGYRKFMVGDDICFNEQSLDSALNVLTAIYYEH